MATPDRGETLAGVRVLVVDDESDVRHALGALLQRAGAVVLQVASVTEALDAVQTFPPQVLLSDIDMPGETGYGLIQTIRAMETQHGGYLPAAAITAFSRGQDRRRALSAGFQLYLTKPVDPDELIRAVDTLARSSSRGSRITA